MPAPSFATLRPPRAGIAVAANLAAGLRLAQALSLDVVVGVLCAAAFAAAASRATMPAAWWLALPAITWAVYAADHLLDAARVGPGAGTERHRLHARHFGVIAVNTGVVAVAGAALALAGLPARLWPAAMVCGLAALAHLALAGLRVAWWPKELSAAAIYAAGIWFAPLIEAPSRGPALAGLVALHLLAAFVNLSLFALLDLTTDRLDGHPSLARRLGPARCRRLVVALGGAGTVLAAAGALVAPAPLERAFAALAVVLAVSAAIALRPPARVGLARAVGDLAFLALAWPWLAWIVG